MVAAVVFIVFFFFSFGAENVVRAIRCGVHTIAGHSLPPRRSSSTVFVIAVREASAASSKWAAGRLPVSLAEESGTERQRRGGAVSRSKSSWKSVAVVAVAQTRRALDADAAVSTSARLCDRMTDEKGSATASGFGREGWREA